MARFHLRREHLVLQVAVRESRALDQRQHALGFRDRPRQRLFAGDAAERPLASLDGIDDFFDVLEAPMVGPREPERVDRGIGDHVANAGVGSRLADVETARALRGRGGVARRSGSRCPARRHRARRETPAGESPR